MTHYSVQFNGVIPELATVRWIRNVFKDRFKTGVEHISLSSVGNQFHAQGRQQKTSPNFRRALGTTVAV